MDLGFSISGAGPLTQMSVPIMSLDTAVYLAIGTYGWWKAREQGQSLDGVIHAKGGSLVPPSTFDRPSYQRRRQKEVIKGIARVPGGKLLSFVLPKASTAMEGDSGLQCLRALISSLLVFYRNQEVVLNILRKVVPDYLINQDQEGKRVDVDGPLLLAMRHYVKSVAKEEEGSSLSKELLDRVDAGLGGMSGASAQDLLKCNADGILETPLVVGLLRWTLTPVLKRDRYCYPTRSLQIWAMARVLSDMGFQIVPSLHAVLTTDDYEAHVSNPKTSAPSVILVCKSVGATDSGLRLGDTKSLEVVAPVTRIVSIESIPWIEFRHVSAYKGKMTTEFLAKLWTESFTHAQKISNLRTRGTNSGVTVCFDSRLRDLISIWSNEIIPYVAELVEKWVSLPENATRSKEIIDDLKVLGLRRPIGRANSAKTPNSDFDKAYLEKADADLVEIWHMMTTIIMAAVIGIRGMSLRRTTSANVDVDGVDGSSEMAINVGFLYSYFPYQHAKALDEIQNIRSYPDHRFLSLVQLFTGGGGPYYSGVYGVLPKGFPVDGPGFFKIREGITGQHGAYGVRCCRYLRVNELANLDSVHVRLAGQRGIAKQFR